MHNFVFHNPTKILFGQGTLASIGAETRAWGQRVLLVTGRASLRASGVHARILALLEEAGCQVAELSGVQPNPRLSLVRRGIALARAHGTEVLVAAGGGSVIDTAKAIAAGVPVAHDVWKFFTGKKGLKCALPVTVVATMAGSGSEMNTGMVLTNDDTGHKFGFGHRLLHPKTSILDPLLTCTVPPAYTAYGAVDAISHVLEFYLSTAEPHTGIQDRLMEGLIETTMLACNRCLLDPLDYHARAELMWAAALALSGLPAAGLGRVGFPMHLIEHSLGALYDTPHGAGLAVVLLGWLRTHGLSASHRLAPLGQRVFMLPQQSPQDLALATIDGIAAWLEAIKAPRTLADLDIPPAAIPEIAEHTRALARIWRLDDYPPQRVAAILDRCRFSMVSTSPRRPITDSSEKEDISP